MKKKPVILVVDDQPQNIELLEAYLVPEDYEVITAANGAEALAILAANPIDLVLLDVLMPGMDGFEVTRRIRQDTEHRQLPIILVTSLREMEDKIKGLEAGCDEFLSRPFDKVELLVRIRSLLKAKAYNDLMSNYQQELKAELTKKTEELKLSLERDIAEREKREAESAFLVSFAEHDPNPVMELDAAGNLKHVNPAATRLFPELSALGSSHPFLLGWKSVVDELQNDKTHVATREIAVGSSWYLQTVAFMLSTQSFRIYGKDITERKQLEEKQSSLALLASIGQLSGSIAHELRNPLAVVDSSLYFLNKTLPNADAKTKEHLGRMKDGIRRSVDIIQALLNLTRLREPVTFPLDLKEFANQMVDESELPAVITIVREFTTETATVKADRDQLRIVFRNLITNAVQAMDGKGKLRVSISRDGEMVRLSVADTGPGIPAENADKIFQPLFSTKTFGIGLGLAITRQIIEAHQGTIRVEAEPGWGAVFVIRLPLAKE